MYKKLNKNQTNKIMTIEYSNQSNLKFWISVILKSLTVMFVIFASFMNQMSGKGFDGFSQQFLYFTIQSNIWTGLIALVFLVAIVIQKVKNKNMITPAMRTAKLMATMAITLTFIVFGVILLPIISIQTKGDGETFKYLVGPACMFQHWIIPAIAIVDFIFFDHQKEYKYKGFWLALILPAIYLIFTFILMENGMRFTYFKLDDTSPGTSAPYFFLSYKGPAGWFGFSSVQSMENSYIGVFYWIVIMSGLITGIYSLLILLVHVRQDKYVAYHYSNLVVRKKHHSRK